MSNTKTQDINRQLALCEPRLPFHPMISDRFGIDKAAWKSLVEAIFPNATTINSVVLALSYCRARKLDPFKRCVHIVPIWNSQMGCMVDTIWPGIGELRTTAVRTGEYAGRAATEFGADIEKEWTSADGKKKTVVTFPEWAQVSVYRIVKGQRVEFAGPRVYWLETYATTSRADDTPNSMWNTRPRGQIDKCAEAAALRAAFPEEIGSDYISDEVQHGQVIDGATRLIAGENRSTTLLGKLTDSAAQVSSADQGDELEEVAAPAKEVEDISDETIASSEQDK